MDWYKFRRRTAIFFRGMGADAPMERSAAEVEMHACIDIGRGTVTPQAEATDARIDKQNNACMTPCQVIARKVTQ